VYQLKFWIVNAFEGADYFPWLQLNAGHDLVELAEMLS
jgi:hypothetical protein